MPKKSHWRRLDCARSCSRDSLDERLKGGLVVIVDVAAAAAAVVVVVVVVAVAVVVDTDVDGGGVVVVVVVDAVVVDAVVVVAGANDEPPCSALVRGIRNQKASVPGPTGYEDMCFDGSLCSRHRPTYRRTSQNLGYPWLTTTDGDNGDWANTISQKSIKQFNQINQSRVGIASVERATTRQAGRGHSAVATRM